MIWSRFCLFIFLHQYISSPLCTYQSRTHINYTKTPQQTNYVCFFMIRHYISYEWWNTYNNLYLRWRKNVLPFWIKTSPLNWSITVSIYPWSRKPVVTSIWYYDESSYLLLGQSRGLSYESYREVSGVTEETIQ